MNVDTSAFLINYCLSGIVCLGSASAYHGMSVYPSCPVAVYTEYDKHILTNHIEIIPVKKLDLRFTESIRKGLLVTDPIRTTIDLINSNKDEEFIYETLETYLDDYTKGENSEGYNKLFKVAEIYNATEKLKYRIATMEEFFDDFNE